ncbi:MAG: alpha-galactosidase, partial [Planctomycetes bacterium]|nr:alpha-galactosidase [Planctomycetota bacterium]
FSPTHPQDGTKLILRGAVSASGQAFPAETSSDAQKRFPCVRNSVGLSRNLRNNAVYDRRWDWLLAGPGDGQTRIAPRRAGNGHTTFSWTSQGTDLDIVFRPRYYQKHRGYKYFMPWTYDVWTGSVTGYCTWWAYRANFTQKTLDALLNVFVRKHLPDFGYTYMQFDNCYQVGNGSCPQNWLNWNARKYPGGWKYAVKAIRQAHMKPGIWVHRIHRPSDPHVADIARRHPDWFLHKPDGSLFMHRGFYVLDTTNKEALDNMARKLYRGLARQGWAYVKIDGAGDLLNAYKSKDCAEFFSTHHVTPEQSLRKWDEVAREELGPNTYILTCHSVWPGRCSVGLVDGCRLSNDGFQPRTLAQYNSLGGVLWRNDPDHCDVMGTYLMDPNAMMTVFGLKKPVPARSIARPAFCTMAGAVLMASDKVEVYQDDRNIEGMKRSSPILFTVPGQLFDPGRKKITWWLLEIDRPFDHWSVLARFQWAEKVANRKLKMPGLPPQEVKFADLGLDANTDYLVFEFWSQKYIGKFRGSFTAPAMDANTAMDVFAIRRARPHPSVLSTTRHLSQGGVSLLDEKWDAAGGVLSGRSAVVQDDPYVLTVYVPAGYRLEHTAVEGFPANVKVAPPIVSIRVVPRATKVFNWQLRFRRL